MVLQVSGNLWCSLQHNLCHTSAGPTAISVSAFLSVLYKLSRDTGAPLDRAVTVTPLISKPAIFSEPISSQARSGQVWRRRCSGGFFPLSSSCFLSQEGRNPLKPDFTHQPSWNVCLAWGRSTNTPSSWELTKCRNTEKH